MTPTDHTAGNKPGRVEGTVQVVILLAIGLMAAAASFTHVHDLTVAHGQPDWIGWANSVVLELMSIAAGIEIRRRKRNHQPAGFVLAVLIAAVALSLAAQVAEAQPSPWGWTVAALPALGFLALVKIVLGRNPATRDEPAVTEAQSLSEPATTPVASRDDLAPELLTGARMAAFTHHQTHGHPITRDALAEHLGITTEIAGSLLHALNAPASIGSGVNGHPVAGRG